MAYTFTSSAAIDNLPLPFSFACFGQRPNNTNNFDLIAKGSTNFLRDNGAITNNQYSYTRQASSVDGFARSASTWTVADGIIHTVVTVSSAGAIKIYRNGSEVTYTATPTNISGSLSSDAGSNWIFNLDSVTHAAIWGTELSASDVTALYNGGAGVNVYTVQSASIKAAQDSPTPVYGSLGQWDPCLRIEGWF